VVVGTLQHGISKLGTFGEGEFWFSVANCDDDNDSNDDHVGDDDVYDGDDDSRDDDNNVNYDRIMVMMLMSFFVLNGC